ncbi:MAG: hypothetical protein COA54_02225 [Thiotrichaceae bacterium]|nr:MAG: hypothetical protein COA54_02225 [Thiotrichaceae bacterium]
MEPLKNIYNKTRLNHLANEIAKQYASFDKRAFKKISTQKYYAGKHPLTIINGVELTTKMFVLTL